MLVSTKGRYALRVVIDLAEHQAEGRTPLKQIAARQDISEKYLENILATLVHHRILSGMRGKGGGYRLDRTPDTITVGEILRLTEGSLAPVACLTCSGRGCERAKDCRTIDMWSGLDEVISGYLDGITIADLAIAADDPNVPEGATCPQLKAADDPNAE